MEFPFISGKSNFLKYYNLARCFSCHVFCSHDLFTEAQRERFFLKNHRRCCRCIYPQQKKHREDGKIGITKAYLLFRLDVFFCNFGIFSLSHPFCFLRNTTPYAAMSSQRSMIQFFFYFWGCISEVADLSPIHFGKQSATDGT